MSAYDQEAEPNGEQVPDQEPESAPVPIRPTPKSHGCLWGCGITLLLGVAALIIVPNFLRACPRSPVSRVRSDQRSLATAIEAYYVDNNAYPAWTSSSLEAIHGEKGGMIDLVRYPTFRAPNGGGLATLTTPAAYIIEYYPDIFAPDETAPFRYRATEYSWLLWSAGPNRQFEITGDRVPALMQDPRPNDELLSLTYDPSNGTFSTGDIWRLKQ